MAELADGSDETPMTGAVTGLTGALGLIERAPERRAMVARSSVLADSARRARRLSSWTSSSSTRWFSFVNSALPRPGESQWLSFVTG